MEGGPGSSRVASTTAEHQQYLESALCQKCLVVADSWPRVVQQDLLEFGHHGSKTELLASAQNGCGLCAQFVAGYEEVETWYDSDDRPAPTTGILKVQKSNDRVFRKLELEIPYSRGDLDAEYDEWQDQEDIFLCYDVDLVPTLFQDLTEPAETMQSTLDGMPLAKTWFSECRATHGSCTLAKNLALPTRLVQIADAGLRLCLSSELQDRVTYATLSHCWGSLQFCSLKRRTLHDFRRRIPEDALTKTFRDAIYIARYLGLQYLWIDSLCIIQDDFDDWTRESALMAAVYGGAELNIAASSAVDGSIGCFFDRGKHWRFQLRTNSDQGEAIYECVPHRTLYPHDLHVPLHTRGWVVQERWLSKRILHCFRQQLFWECEHRPACEIFPSGFPPSFGAWTSFFRQKQSISQEQWPSIAFDYSCTTLTKTSDKFVAISGLAQLIQAQNGGEYLAGMWRNQLESQLCWHSLNTSVSRTTLHTGAPSWSWVSLYGPISFPHNNDSDALFTTIQDVQVDYSLTPYGAIKGGLLRIQCNVLCPCSLSPIREDGIALGTLLHLGNSHLNPIIWFDIHGTDEAPKIQCYLLPVKGTRRQSTGGLLLEGLLLEQLGKTRSRKGQYRRIAYFCNLSEDEFWTACESPSSLAQESDYSEIVIDTDSGRKHIIDIT